MVGVVQAYSFVLVQLFFLVSIKHILNKNIF